MRQLHKRERERGGKRWQYLTRVHALRLKANFGSDLVVAGKPILSRQRGAPCNARGWEQIILEQFALQIKVSVKHMYQHLFVVEISNGMEWT